MRRTWQVVHVALLAGIRVFGRRELGQMTPFDLVLILLIANAVQNAMVGTDTSVTGRLVVAGTLLVPNLLVTVLRNRVPIWRAVTEGEPVLLINGGRVLTDQFVAGGQIDFAAHGHVAVWGRLVVGGSGTQAPQVAPTIGYSRVADRSSSIRG